MFTIFEITTAGIVTKRKSDTEPTLAELQKVVGGYIERVVLSNGTMWVNEEGKMMNLDLNEKATALAKGRIFPGDWISGDVVVILDE